MNKTTSNKSAKNQEGVPQKPPFPTQAEIVRAIINALATKPTNAAKKLDDYVVAGDANYQKFSEMVEGFIFDPIKSLTCESFAKFLKLEVDRFFKSYLGLVKLIALDRLTRQEAFPLLVEHYFSVRASGFLANFQTQSNGFNPIQFVDNDKTAIEAVFNWFDENEKGWDSNCIKEDKDKYANWRKGNNLPDLQSIKLIRENLNLSPENITLLLIARAVDFFRNSVIGRNGIDSTRKHLLLGFDQYDHGEPLSLAQINANKKYSLSIEAIKNCSDLLLDSTDCSGISKDFAYERIEELKAAFNKDDPNGLMSYLVNWCEARWYVKTGDLKTAVKFYKKAFKQCLYSAGKEQEIIYKDALKVAAKAEDLAFLKQLKNYGIVFGFFIAPPKKDELDLEVNNKINQGTSNIVEDWEIERWIKEFHQEFTEKMLFKGIDPYKKEIKQIPLSIVNGSIKPDFSNPNRVIKVDWKRMPQLVYFILSDDLQDNNIAIIKQLLKKGADVNVASETGDTPILLAIQSLDLFEPTASLDNSCYKLLSSHSHTKKTVNRRTSKLKLLPLICAVNTGKVDVVSKLLDWGADIDRRGETDEQTALNICLNKIAMVQNPDKFTTFIKHSMQTKPSPALLEDIRRRSGGNTLNEVKEIFATYKNNKIFKSVQKVYIDMMLERIGSLDIEDLREIALLLIQKGASPNAEHNSAIKGYTPLMLAAEDDEAELFEEMLGYGGKPDKCYQHPETGQKINCFKIAIAFKSHKVAKILKSKYGDHFFRANNH